MTNSVSPVISAYHPTGRRDVLENVLTGVCVAVACGIAECAINETIRAIQERREQRKKAAKTKPAKVARKRGRKRKTEDKEG